MQKITLGKSGLQVSRIGFGGIPIQRCTEEDAIRVVRRCLDYGINFIDTAAAYGTSEERISKAIARRRRENFIIATKTTNRTREGAAKDLEASLRWFGYIDLYQFHGVNDLAQLRQVTDPDGPMAVVRDAHRKGLVRHIGITSHAIDAARAAVETDLFETVLFPFNFVTREPGIDLLEAARKHKVGYIAMKPLNGGMLKSVGVAFKYLLQYPDVVPVVGIQAVQEIDEIMGVFRGPRKMTEAETKEMYQLQKDLGSRFCRRCDYCQPCEQGIRMSSVFFIRSMAMRSSIGPLFARATPIMEKTTGCIECGKCEERCPYKLPIRQMLKEEYDWFMRAKKEWEAAPHAQGS